MAFNVPHDDVLWETNLSSFAYTRLLGVETFSFHVEVTLLHGCMTCAIGFPCIVSGRSFILFFSFTSLLLEIILVEGDGSKSKRIILFLRVKTSYLLLISQGKNGKEN